MRRTLAVAVLLLATMLGGTNAGAVGPGPTGDVIRRWNDVALQTVRTKNASDAQAARLYAMVNAAMYDAVNGLPGLGQYQRRGYAIVPSRLGTYGDVVAAAAGAARDVLAGLYPDQVAVYDAQLAADLAPLIAPLRTAGRAWGGEVAAQVLAARANDGSSPPETQPGGSGPGVFTGNFAGAQFRNLAPFAIGDPNLYVSPGPPGLTSLDYAAAYAEVQLVGNKAIPDAAKLATYTYWSLGNNTSQPPGAWLQVAKAVSTTQSLSLADTARLFALESVAMADTVAPTYMTKFLSHSWRPTTAIRQIGTDDGNPYTTADPTWTARADTVGGTPEHWSGHSSFSAAAASVLRGFFCKDAIPFSLVTDTAPGGAARNYASFSDAATEAGRSRVVGGLHFEFSNQAGLTAGRAIASEVLAHELLPRYGQTHHGECPL